MNIITYLDRTGSKYNFFIRMVSAINYTVKINSKDEIECHPLPREIDQSIKDVEQRKISIDEFKIQLQNFCSPIIKQWLTKLSIENHPRMLPRLREYVVDINKTTVFDDSLFYIPQKLAKHLKITTRISAPTLIIHEENESISLFSAIPPDFALAPKIAEQLFLDTIFIDEQIIHQRDVIEYLTDNLYKGTPEDKIRNIVQRAPHPSKIKPSLSFIQFLDSNLPKDFDSKEAKEYAEASAEECHKKLAETEDPEELDLILQWSIKNNRWKNGLSSSLDVAISRINQSNQPAINVKLFEHCAKLAALQFPYNEEASDRLHDLVAQTKGASIFCSENSQIIITNLQAAYFIRSTILNADIKDQEEAVSYAESRASDLIESTNKNYTKALRKIMPWVKKGESRAAAAVLNEAAENDYLILEDPHVSDLYYKIMLSTTLPPKMLDLCEELPALKARLIIRECSARHYISSGQIEKARSHVQAIQNFEPNSETSLLLKQMIERATAIENIASNQGDLIDIDNLTGVDFERLLIRKLTSLGFSTQETPSTGDYGADIIAEDDDGTRYIIQCKRFGSKVNLKAVQEIAGAMKHYNADYAAVATNNEFLNSAIELAKSNKIELWNGTAVLRLLSGDISFSALGSAKINRSSASL